MHHRIPRVPRLAFAAAQVVQHPAQLGDGQARLQLQLPDLGADFRQPDLQRLALSGSGARGLPLDSRHRSGAAIPRLQERRPLQAGAQRQAKRRPVERRQAPSRGLQLADQRIDPAAAQPEPLHVGHHRLQPTLVRLAALLPRRGEGTMAGQDCVEPGQGLRPQSFFRTWLGRHFLGRGRAARRRVQFDQVAQRQPPVLQRLTPDGDGCEGRRALAQRRQRRGLPRLEPLRQGDLLLARQQLGVADVAQEHADRIGRGGAGPAQVALAGFGRAERLLGLVRLNGVLSGVGHFLADRCLDIARVLWHGRVLLDQQGIRALGEGNAGLRLLVDQHRQFKRLVHRLSRIHRPPHRHIPATRRTPIVSRDRQPRRNHVSGRPLAPGFPG